MRLNRGKTFIGIALGCGWLFVSWDARTAVPPVTPNASSEAKRQHQLGSLITICWHAVPPTANEPVTFRPPRDTPSNDGNAGNLDSKRGGPGFVHSTNGQFIQRNSKHHRGL